MSFISIYTLLGFYIYSSHTSISFSQINIFHSSQRPAPHQSSHSTFNYRPIQLLVFPVHFYPSLRSCTFSIFYVFSSPFFFPRYVTNLIRLFPSLSLSQYSIYSSIRSITQSIFRPSSFRYVFLPFRCLVLPLPVFRWRVCLFLVAFPCCGLAHWCHLVDGTRHICRQFPLMPIWPHLTFGFVIPKISIRNNYSTSAHKSSVAPFTALFFHLCVASFHFWFSQTQTFHGAHKNTLIHTSPS